MLSVSRVGSDWEGTEVENGTGDCWTSLVLVFAVIDAWPTQSVQGNRKSRMYLLAIVVN